MLVPKMLFHSRGLSVALVLAPLVACATLQDMSQGRLGGSDPSTGEVVDGLKQALAMGASQAVSALAKEGGYGADALLRIPFPEEAAFAANALRKIGLGGLVHDFEDRLNRGAEAGAKRALPIFEDAIRGMSFADARQVLLGGEHAATDYFQQHTYESLIAAFRPEIESALGKAGATEIWTELSSRYNSIPIASKKLDTDIVHYATERALDGLFHELAAEEGRIRADPVARTTALLQKVFGYAAAQL